MIAVMCDQRTPEWYAARLGKFTASMFADLMPAKSKGVDTWTEGQTKLIYKVVSERMTGKKADAFTSYSMQWGVDTEITARKVYEIETGADVQEIGFLELNEWVGCSPDGLVGIDGTWEAKCPNSDTHLMYSTIPGKLAEEYHWQVQGQLWISGRKWCDLMSFDPRFIDLDRQLFIARIPRDEEAIARLSARIESAIAIAETIQGAK